LRQHLYDGERQTAQFSASTLMTRTSRAKGDHTPINDGDEISIVPSIAGGNLNRI